MKALVDDSGKVLIGSDGKVATDDCPGDCCFPVCLSGVDSISVEISGVVVGCGCQEFAFPSGLASKIYDDISINGTFTVPRWDDTRFILDSAGTYREQGWFSSGCTPTLAEDVSPGSTIVVFCNGHKDFAILYYGFDNAILFYATGIDSATAIPNVLNCGDVFTSGSQFQGAPAGEGANLLGVTAGGTATITWTAP